MNLGVFGAGYVGLVTATCLAEMGHHVVCCDIDAERVARLQRGEVPIFEPGLEELLQSNMAEGRLRFTTDPAATVKESEVLFIAVGTPPDEDGSADVRHVLEVARTIGRFADGPRIVVNKSTVPVGTADRVREVLAESTRHACIVVSNPEFLKEGTAVEDFMKPDRIVVGADDEEGREVLRAIYSPFLRTGNPVLFMDTRSAEMTKYAANAMLATRITFMNEIANLCDRVGADVDAVRAGIGSDRRIGSSFLFPGVGFGGSCFPKDVQALERLADEVAYDFDIIRAVHRVNELQKRLLVDRVIARFGEDLKGRRFAIWGLAFKPRTDDIREAPSLVIIRELLLRGATIRAFDPKAVDNTRGVFDDGVEFTSEAYEALIEADALIVVTEWNEFRFPDFERIRRSLKEPVVFDGRNVYEPTSMAELGFEYHSIGRPLLGPAGPAEQAIATAAGSE
ncbi:MAG TPA: UDP-glucose/GDP-mannose dehydrogenase family protein [Gemmatimonadota bacterium]|nr:UDP-glucose/GDP-mannose dehydrogenase family protein [Gemmatimonadota bacterium]